MALDDGALVLEVAHIVATTPGGPRYQPSVPDKELQTVENLIVLCPTHHMLVDRQPQNYPADFLRQLKAAHAKAVAEALSEAEPIAIPVRASGSQSQSTYSAALEFWRANRASNEEERWQEFFTVNPKILALLLPDDLIMIGAKCYLGGKEWNNKGGKVVDFLYASRQTLGVTIIEIKTPMTRLMGEEYRSNVVLPDKDLSGSLMQVWTYRDTAMKNYYSISKEDWIAFNPRCVVIIGDLEQQKLDENSLKSFELFRNSLAHTSVITFDALFLKVAATLDLL